MAVSGVITQEQITQLVNSDLVSNNKTLEMIDLQRERQIQAKTELEEIRVAADGLEASLETLKDAATFYSSSVSSSDTAIVTAEAGANSSLTSYDISNITMAKAAQKVSTSTLGLSDATSAYYESTASVEDLSAIGMIENAQNFDDWSSFVASNGRGVLEATTFDGEDVFSFYAKPANGRAEITQELGVGSIPTNFKVDLNTYFDNLGSQSGGNALLDAFQIHVDNGSVNLEVAFANDGLKIYNGSSWQEVGVDEVTQDSWNDWSFEVSGTSVSVFKDSVQVGTSFDLSGTTSSSEGHVELEQYGFYTSGTQSYLNSMQIQPLGVQTGIANENVILDGSQGNTNLAGAISDGYFEINGQRVNVDTSEDTLMEVLSKINAAETGVTATWNDDQDTIRLTVDEGGLETIDFGTDTSGFLAAMNIDTAAPTATGVESAWDRELDQVVALSSISNGYFNINGITFDVDTSVDSLSDIINDINQSSAGVSAYYEKSLDKVVMTSTQTGENITFGNDTSNFIATVMGDLNEATFTQGSADVNGQTIAIDSNEFEIGDVKFKVHSESVEGATVTVARDTEKATVAIEDFVTKYNELRTMIDEKTIGGQPLSNDRTLRNIENNLRHYVLNPISNTGSFDFLRDVGIQYRKGRLSLNKTDLEDAFRTDPSSVGTIFGYDGDGDGIRNDGGLSNTMIYDFLSNVTSKYSGDIGRKNTLMDNKITKLNHDYKKYEKVIAKKTDRLYAEYTRFADAVNQMQAQFTAFQAQMSQLNNLTSSLYSNTSSSSF